jgi:hypothetical protein
MICSPESAQGGGDWDFTLLPLSQTCPGRPPLLVPVLAWPVGFFLVGAVVCAAGVGVFLLSAALRETLPSASVWYLISLGTGVLVAVTAATVRYSDTAPDSEQLIFTVACGMLVGLLVTGLVAAAAHLHSLGQRSDAVY